MGEVDVSIILVNYNTKKLTSECIDSIFRYTKGVRFEVILVDNGSVDGSKELFSENQRILYYYNNDNLGFGPANNIGAEHAVGKVLLFLNTDTVLIDDAISKLFFYLESQKDAVVCGGNLLTKEREPSNSYERLFPSIAYELNELFLRIPGKLIYGRNGKFNHKRKAIKVKYISGADLMIYHDLFDSLSGFDSNFFMYYEETDLCKRAKKYGEIYSYPLAQIIHYGGKSSKDSLTIPSEHKLIIQANSRDYYLSKHFSKSYLELYYFISKLRVKSRILEYSILGKNAIRDMWKLVLKTYK